MNSAHEFNHNMNQLIEILKKMLMQGPASSLDHNFASAKDPHIQFNICFFNFIPLSTEDYEELEEAYEDYLSAQDDKPLEQVLTPTDVEFLKRHGIRF